ncbi:hypothetical protein SAMN05444521_6343 [Streptomyces sp. 3214.6]|nr:hypothetical protein SAMN05444521_6343 [Streptomyces sp. 3214.6]
MWIVRIPLVQKAPVEPPELHVPEGCRDVAASVGQLGIPLAQAENRLMDRTSSNRLSPENVGNSKTTERQRRITIPLSPSCPHSTVRSPDFPAHRVAEHPSSNFKNTSVLCSPALDSQVPLPLFSRTPFEEQLKYSNRRDALENFPAASNPMLESPAFHSRTSRLSCTNEASGNPPVSYVPAHATPNKEEASIKAAVHAPVTARFLPPPRPGIILSKYLIEPYGSNDTPRRETPSDPHPATALDNQRGAA